MEEREKKKHKERNRGGRYQETGSERGKETEAKMERVRESQRERENQRERKRVGVGREKRKNLQAFGALRLNLITSTLLMS